jgi:S-DNA-T family DNA segregation ATPase FtsK/SpoIIIE
LKIRLEKNDALPVDVAVTVDSTVTVGEIAKSLLDRQPSADGLEIVGDVTLATTYPGESRPSMIDPATPVSEAPIASGARVRISDSSLAASGEKIRGIIRVVDGPDRGREFQVRGGQSVIGRDASADIVLSDPLVSKRHARVEFTTTADIVDLNSANGLSVDGGLVPRASLRTGDVAVLGDSVLRFEVLVSEATTVRRGPVPFNHSPRVEPRYAGTEYEAPEVPKEEEPQPFPWVALAAPAVMGVAFLFLPETSAFRFLFIALAPIIMIGTWLSQVIVRRRRRAIALQKFDAQLAYLDQTLATESIREREVRLNESPTTDAVLSASKQLQPLLWTRRPEHWSFLNVHLGIGAAPSRNSVKGVNSRNGEPQHIERFEDVVERHRLVDGVPLIDNLREAGALGLAGDESDVGAVADAILVQLTGLHSPSELVVSAIVSPTWAQHFDWIKWLPHTSSPHTPLPGIQLADSLVSGNDIIGRLEALIVTRTAEISGPTRQHLGAVSLDDAVSLRGARVGEDGEQDDDLLRTVPAVVLLVTDDAPVDRARLVSLIERATAAGIYPVWIAASTADLPAACRTFLSVARVDGKPIGDVGYVRLGERFSVAPPTIAAAAALEHALAIAGVSDSGAFVADESDVPRSVSLASLLGVSMLDEEGAVIERWKENDSIIDRRPGAQPTRRRPGRLRAIVGQASLDALHLDLRTQGPHALVGGTTGSGKSEFLQAWVLGLAAEVSPDRVTFLFVDYKGGSAFAECVELPHCVGLVTDLSPHLVRRALTSLRAELHHRERLFNRKKVKDLLELEKRGDPECPPALIIVIDEFAALVGDVPEFVDGVVDIAQRGRSLGIHLIMATQRPAGVIKDNLRANTNLRIALRMADPHDSVDVVGSPIAAGFDPSIPGRAILKAGPGRLETFQTGYAGGWTSAEAAPPAIGISDLTFGLERAWEDLRDDDDAAEVQDPGPNDTARLVGSITRAARAASIPTPRKPWLDELGAVYDLARLRQRTDGELVLGVADDPENQDQRTVVFRPDTDGNLAVFGTGGSGKSTALRSIATAAAITPRGGPVEVYGIDFSSGGLRMLEVLPHVGSIIAGDDNERIVRLMRMLRETIDDRVVRYGAVRAGSIAEYRTLGNSPTEPRLLLLIDGMATFRQEYEYTGASNVFSMFQQILADGRQVGVHVIVSADRPASVPPSVASAIQRRVALRMADENDYLLLDAPADVVSASSPPGRAVVDGLETQLAVFGGSSSTAVPAALDALAATLSGQGVRQAPPIERLSELIPFGDLGVHSRDAALIGVADDSLQPVAIVPEGVFLVAGPPGSGRSTALRTLHAAVRSARPEIAVYYLGSARSEIGGLPGVESSATDPESAAALIAQLTPLAQKAATATNGIALIIEGITDFLGTSVDQDLAALVKSLRRNDHFVIAENEISGLLPNWPLLMELKSARRGFVLQPDPQEAETLMRTGMPRVRRADFPPGRGLLVQGGKTVRVQLAYP